MKTSVFGIRVEDVRIETRRLRTRKASILIATSHFEVRGSSARPKHDILETVSTSGNSIQDVCEPDTLVMFQQTDVSDTVKAYFDENTTFRSMGTRVFIRNGAERFYESMFSQSGP